VRRQPESAPYRLEDMADDAVTVLDALGWTSAHIVGHSMGGMIAQTTGDHSPRPGALPDLHQLHPITGHRPDETADHAAAIAGESGRAERAGAA
jgi:pimeloyl-ACP methyl ester carboxylesterase